MDNSIVTKSADNIRILSAAMVEKANSGHPGGAMGGADFINILYTEFLNFDPKDLAWPNRDRFFLDPGHMSPMLYSQLTLIGSLTMDDIKQFRQWGSPTPGHPEVDPARGIENTSGPLGQGHTMAVGAAIAERFLTARFGNWMSHKIYTFISDGGVQEEISQGAGRLAGHLGLSNLIMFYDSNDIQLSHRTEDATSEDTAAKYTAWGWRVLEINGNDPDQIRGALSQANEETEKPTIIIGKTTMGKGALDADGNNFEGKTSTHGQPLGKAGGSLAKTVENLGGDPKDPFKIFPEVKKYYDKVLKEKAEYAASKKKEQQEWASKNPELASKFEKFFKLDISKIDFSAIEQKKGSATRGASGNVLKYLAENVENMIVASADLSESDKTNTFLDKTTILSKNNFKGAFLQAGVSELTMAAAMNGMALHGGVIPVCGTFFVFSDYMKPAVRLSALMQLPVKFVWTHDAFRVGEDGPTHQPVEQEAQIRLLEQLKNHHGKNSLLALRPADADETTVAWQMALENTDSPTALILSRQNIDSLPNASYDTALKAKKGAYVVSDSKGKPDVILLANGSEVSTLVEGGKLLEEKKGLKVRIVSAISEGVFRDQPEEYQKEVLPDGIPVVGLTAGLPVTLKGLAGDKSLVIGMESFGFSAPYTVLDEKLGYTGTNVFNKTVEYLGV